MCYQWHWSTLPVVCPSQKCWYLYTSLYGIYPSWLKSSAPLWELSVSRSSGFLFTVQFLFCCLIELIYNISITFTNAIRKFIFVRLLLLSAGEETELVLQTGHFIHTYNRVFFFVWFVWILVLWALKINNSLVCMCLLLLDLFLNIQEKVKLKNRWRWLSRDFTNVHYSQQWATDCTHDIDIILTCSIVLWTRIWSLYLWDIWK